MVRCPCTQKIAGTGKMRKLYLAYYVRGRKLQSAKKLEGKRKLAESSAEAAPVPWRLASVDSVSESCSKPRNPVVPGLFCCKMKKENSATHSPKGKIFCRAQNRRLRRMRTGRLKTTAAPAAMEALQSMKSMTNLHKNAKYSF